MRSYHVLGLDIGFSKARRSSGVLVAEVRDGVFLPVEGPHNLTETEARSRARDALERREIKAVALDATVAATTQSTYRPVERLFSRGRFQKHCKPGSTGSPVGRGLHAAGMAMIKALQGSAAYAHLSSLAAPKGVPVLEVFPTAALGVLMPFGCMNGVSRSKKSDSFFELLWSEHDGRMGGLRLDPRLRVSNHDQRMAVVAAALAALYVEGRCSAIGEDVSGYFLMPHFDDWLESWRDALRLNLTVVAGVTVWSGLAAK